MRYTINVIYGLMAATFYELIALSPIYSGVLYKCHYIYTV